MIKATFYNQNRYNVSDLYQWDLNQVMTVYGLSLPSVPEFHFINDTMSRSIVRQATMDNAGVISVEIPNALLQKPYTITAHICIRNGDKFKSLYKMALHVKPRNKPTDYTIEGDEDIYSFNVLENLVYEAVANLNVNTEKIISQVKESNEKLETELNAKYDDHVSMLEGTRETAETALDIAKGKNQAHVFNTTNDLYSWLANPNNAGLYQVGDNLYIVDTDVPDWWISEVLTEADAETGYYYKIAKLETQKVDLTNIEEQLTELDSELKTRVKASSFTTVEYESDVFDLGTYENKSLTFNIAKSGYTPLSINAVRVTGDDYYTTIYCYDWNMSINLETAYLKVKQIGDGKGLNVKIILKILYVKK